MRQLGLKYQRSAIIPNGLDLADISTPSAEDLAWVGALRQPVCSFLSGV